MIRFVVVVTLVVTRFFVTFGFVVVLVAFVDRVVAASDATIDTVSTDAAATTATPSRRTWREFMGMATSEEFVGYHEHADQI